jgi:hypothetical protein
LLVDPGDVAVDDIRDYVERSIEKERRRFDDQRKAELAEEKRIADAEPKRGKRVNGQRRTQRRGRRRR